MKILFSNLFILKLSIIATICLACLTISLFAPLESVSIVFIVLLLTVCGVGSLTGIVPSLGISLIIMFSMGSLYFWTEYMDSSFRLSSVISLNLFFFWSTSLVLLSLLTGQIHGRIEELMEQNRYLQKKFTQLVAVDPLTGFDNKQRMILELNEELNRAKRYGNEFSFLLIQMDHFHEFEKLYGEKETNHLLQQLADKLNTLTRISDQKYRVETNVFAVLLTHTTEQQVELIIHKLKDHLPTHTLLNGNMTTLSMKFGYSNFEPSIPDANTLYEIAENELVTYV